MTGPRRRPDTTRPGSRDGPDGPPLEALDFESARALPERHLGRFVVTAELGRGGMGVVYRGIDPALQRPVAIKLLWGGRSGRRFATEAHTAARIRHPHVIPVHEIGVRDDDGAAYLVMDFVEGETLAERVDRDGPLPPADAARYTMQIAGALAAAHRQGVLHRDVKPSNVLLSEVGAQLTDFGLAKDLAAGPSGLSTDGTFLGTPGFAPPEQATGALSQIGPHSDVYGLGATLYYALTGEPPVEITSLHETVIATCAHEPTPPSELSPGLDAALEAICLRCLAKEPDDRPADAAALEAELAEALGAPAPGRGRGAGVALAALGVLTVLAAAGGAAWLNAPAPPADPDPVSALSSPVDPLAEAVAGAEAALLSGDALGALRALPLKREVDSVGAAALRLAERAVASAPDAPAVLAHLDALPPGTTRDHLRCQAALLNGQLEPLLAELRRAPDAYRRRLNAACELEVRLRELDALMAPIEAGPAPSNGALGPQLETLGLLLFSEAKRLFAADGLPPALVAALQPRFERALAMLLANYGEAIGPCPPIYAAGKAYQPRCLPETAPGFGVGLYVLGLRQGEPHDPSTLPDVEPLSLPPLLGLLLYTMTPERRPWDDDATVVLAEAILALLEARPGLLRRFTSAWADQRLLLIRLHRRRALGELRSPPDPDGPELQRALARGEEVVERTHDEHARTEHALTLMCCGRGDDEIRELLQFVGRGSDHAHEKELLLAELELRAGQPQAALDRLDALRERPEQFLPIDTHALRAHALALLGEDAASRRALKAAPRWGEPWIPWRSPQLLDGLLEGTVWWPGAE